MWTFFSTRNWGQISSYQNGFSENSRSTRRGCKNISKNDTAARVLSQSERAGSALTQSFLVPPADGRMDGHIRRF